MSIASNVIDTNTKLTAIRNALRQLLTEHGIVYYNDDDVFTLARRVWFLIHPTNGAAGGSYSDSAAVGQPVDITVNQNSDDGETIPDGAVADFAMEMRNVHMFLKLQEIQYQLKH